MHYRYQVAQLANPRLLTGSIDPADVESLINRIAAEGWELVTMTSQHGVGVSASVLVVFRQPIDTGER